MSQAWEAEDQFGCYVLDGQKSFCELVGDSCVESVSVVQSAGDEGLGDGFPGAVG